MWAIILRVLRDRKISIIGYSVGMFLLVFMYVAFFPTILEQADKFEELIAAYPKEIFQVFGIDNFRFDTIEKFLAVEYYSILWPIAMIILAIGLAGSAIAGEIENGTIEYLLAKPIQRSKLFLSKYAGGALVVFVFTFVSIFSIIPAATLMNIDFYFKAQVLVFILALLFALSVYGIGMLVSVIVSEKGKVSLITGGLLIIMYILNIASTLVEKAEFLQYFSLFHYFDYNSALIDASVSWGSIFVFLIIIIITTVSGVLCFEKRDIAI